MSDARSNGDGGSVLAVPHIGQKASQFLLDDGVAFARFAL
jgi:hypothetical protein